MSNTRSTNGSNGRGPGGRFARGNPGGPGNPFARKVGQLRAALLRGVKSGDVKAVIVALLGKAKAGDVAAAKLVLAYTLGEPQPFDLLARLEALEAAQEGREGDR
jgi:hypothetical protein